jgi:hypothetical protein
MLTAKTRVARCHIYDKDGIRVDFYFWNDGRKYSIDAEVTTSKMGAEEALFTAVRRKFPRRVLAQDQQDQRHGR